MLILTIRTDKPEAELCLFEDEKKIAYEAWQAHRQLAETIHDKIKKLLDGSKNTWDDLEAVVCFKGPGSFTGLRIGITVANSLAESLKIPIAGTSGGDWIDEGIDQLLNGENENLVLPEYGAAANITRPKK